MILNTYTSKETFKMVFKNATEWVSKNPASAACAVAVAGGATLIAAPGAISTIILSAVGFTGAGVQSGSLAAAAHSTIGNVAAGSIFAALQSAGTGGAALGIVNGVIQGAGAAIFGSAGYVKCWRYRHQWSVKLCRVYNTLNTAFPRPSTRLAILDKQKFRLSQDMGCTVAMKY